MNIKHALFSLFFVGIIFCFWVFSTLAFPGFFAGKIPFKIPVFSNNPIISVSSSVSSGNIDEKLFQEAYFLVKNNYIGFESVRKEDVTAGMIKGLVDSLGDKHSEYFNTEETKSFNEMLSGDFEGIGAVVDKNELGVVIKQVLAGSPAKEGGLLQDDILLKANGEKLEWLSLTDAIKKIRGKSGTQVELEILRAQEKGIITKKITRRQINVPSVDGKMLSGTTTGYITLSLFGEKTEEEFLQKIVELKKAGAKAYILDLRDNGGGFLETAANILSYFVENGKVLVTTKEKDSYMNDSYFSKGTKNINVPVVVLINGNSASASEITAGALKDYNLAILMGEKSYGKGSVQQAFNLSDGSEVKITVAKWYTPLDHGIDKVGITPDITVSFQKEDYEKKYDRQLEEAKKVIELYKKEGREKAILEYTQTQEKNILKNTTQSGAVLSGSVR